MRQPPPKGPNSFTNHRPLWICPRRSNSCTSLLVQRSLVPAHANVSGATPQRKENQSCLPLLYCEFYRCLMRYMRPVSSAFAATLPPDPPVAATASKQQSVPPFHFSQIVPATTSDSSFLFLHCPHCLRSTFSSMQITPSSLGFHHRIRLLPPTLPHLHLLQLATIPIQSAITTIAVPNPPLPELSPPPSFISLVQGGGKPGGG